MSNAQEAVLERDIDLGKIVLIDKSQTGYIELDHLGNTHHSRNVAFLQKGQRGEINVFGFPKNTQLQVQHVIQNTIMQHSSSQPSGMKLTSLNMLPYVNIDQDGNGTIFYGATVTLEPNAIYPDGRYYSTMHIRIRY
jgi:hypothetical protein